MRVELDLSNYATEASRFKKNNWYDTLDFTKKVDLASLKSDGDELDIDKLKTVPVDLRKLSNVINNVLKKPVHDKLAIRVNTSDTSEFVLKTQQNTDKSSLK